MKATGDRLGTDGEAIVAWKSEAIHRHGYVAVYGQGTGENIPSRPAKLRIG
jgi:hypothetical protein